MIRWCHTLRCVSSVGRGGPKTWNAALTITHLQRCFKRGAYFGFESRALVEWTAALNYTEAATDFHRALKEGRVAMAVRKRTWKTKIWRVRRRHGSLPMSLSKAIGTSGQIQRRKTPTRSTPRSMSKSDSASTLRRSKSPTVGEAADLDFVSRQQEGLGFTLPPHLPAAHRTSTLLSFLGAIRLSELNIPLVCDFTPPGGARAGRSPAMVKKTLVRLGSAVCPCPGAQPRVQNVVRNLKARRRKGRDCQVDWPHRSQAESRHRYPDTGWRFELLTRFTD